MAERNHYTKLQKRRTMVYWHTVAKIKGWTFRQASDYSERYLGFHVPDSTLQLWVSNYRKHHKAVISPAAKTHRVLMSPNQEEIPLQKTHIATSDIKDTRTEKQLLATLIAEQRETNATLNVIARYLHTMSRNTDVAVEIQPYPVEVDLVKTNKRKAWKLW